MSAERAEKEAKDLQAKKEAADARVAVREGKAALKAERAEERAERRVEQAERRVEQDEDRAAARRHNSEAGWVTADIDLARLEREDNAKKARLESATDAARRGDSKEMERMLNELRGPDGAAVGPAFYGQAATSAARALLVLAEDSAAQLAELERMTRPGGVLDGRRKGENLVNRDPRRSSVDARLDSLHTWLSIRSAQSEQ